MVAYLESHLTVGLAGPQLQYADGTQQISVYSDPTLVRMIYKISGLGKFTHQRSIVRRVMVQLGIGHLLKVASLGANNTTRKVDVIKGAVMLLRREIFDIVGGMDETTLSYGEEVDWHLRI